MKEQEPPLKVELQLTKNFAIVVEGFYTPPDAGYMYGRHGDGLPPSDAEFQVEAVYDKQGNDITELFDVFDGYLLEQLEKIKKENNFYKCYSVDDVYTWLADKAMTQLDAIEELEMLKRCSKDFR